MEFHNNSKLYLSKREAEVVKEVLKGLPNKEISDRLFVTEKTVKFHLTNVYKKLNIVSRNELISKWFTGQITASQIGPYCWTDEIKAESLPKRARKEKPSLTDASFNHSEPAPLPQGIQPLM